MRRSSIQWLNSTDDSGPLDPNNAAEIGGRFTFLPIDDPHSCSGTRPLTGTCEGPEYLTGYPCVLLDATYCKARVNHRVISQAMVVAIGVAADGRREVLGFDVGDSETEAFWTSFLRSLKTRGLDGVKLVISDVHTGLKKAIGTVFQGASWQRCRVHQMRNILSIVPRASQEMVASVMVMVGLTFSGTGSPSSQMMTRPVTDRPKMSNGRR